MSAASPVESLRAAVEAAAAATAGEEVEAPKSRPTLERPWIGRVLLQPCQKRDRL